MPTKYRQELAGLCEGQLILTVDTTDPMPGVDPKRLLLLYPLPEWETVEQRLLGLSSTHRRAQAIKRLLLGHAEECRLDANGRLLLPGALRQFANLDKHIRLVGQGNKFEIWDEAGWCQYQEECINAKNDASSVQADVDSLSY